MLTRGFLVGAIIDDLAMVGSQVRMRNAVHLFDVSIVAENFFKEFLNILLNAQFKNLNAARSNAPGVDLVDVKISMAIQVTSMANTEKVNRTLEKVTKAQLKKYKRIVVLGLNPRQGSYSLDPGHVAKCNFNAARDIWDLDTLARKTMDLGLEDLERLHKFTRASIARVKIDLEIPDEEGNFPTSTYAHWEARAKARVGSGKAFRDYLVSGGGEPHTPKLAVIKASLEKLAAKLANQPRVTREFLAMLYENRETRKSARMPSAECHVLLGKIERLYRGNDLMGELTLLKHARFITIDDENERELGPAEISVDLNCGLSDLDMSFHHFVEERQLSFRKVVGTVDLSEF
nr:SMEK domain-containing protein [Achromobacter ruhlandii]